MPAARREKARQFSVLCTSACLCKSPEQQMGTDAQSDYISMSALHSLSSSS